MRAEQVEVQGAVENWFLMTTKFMGQVEEERVILEALVLEVMVKEAQEHLALRRVALP
jgi:hypothetical protein